jgi:5-methylcytosine-specific restriction enzyme subunit McrC
MHEADNRFNQLLLFAVFTIVRSAAIVHETTRRNASSLFRLLSGSVSLHHYRGADYGGLRYTRLNQSYQPLHAMARLFVEHAAPALPGAAKSRSVPFWIYMPRLFEEFVAAWLQRNLPSSYSLRVQHRIALPTEERGARGAYRLIPDLVIYRRVEGNKPVAVLDTKYKVVERASDADIHQIYTYASEIGVHEAWIVYPSQPALPLDQTFQRGIRICSAVFDIGGDLDRAGRDFLEQIGIGQ